MCVCVVYVAYASETHPKWTELENEIKVSGKGGIKREKGEGGRERKRERKRKREEKRTHSWVSTFTFYESKCVWFCKRHEFFFAQHPHPVSFISLLPCLFYLHPHILSFSFSFGAFFFNSGKTMNKAKQLLTLEFTILKLTLPASLGHVACEKFFLAKSQRGKERGEKWCHFTLYDFQLANTFFNLFAFHFINVKSECRKGLMSLFLSS